MFCLGIENVFGTDCIGKLDHEYCSTIFNMPVLLTERGVDIRSKVSRIRLAVELLTPLVLAFMRGLAFICLRDGLIYHKK